jgi:hypothetical protein
MASKKITIIFCLIFTFALTLSASDFEGSILFTKQSPYDTAYYEFSVKQNLVRVDIKNSSAQIVQSLIIDLISEKVTALSPNHKLFTVLKKQYKTNFNKQDYKLTKTNNFKNINGYKCYMWRIRNANLNSDISFWVADQGFEFFAKAVKILSASDDYSELCNYFIQVNLNNTFFPILIVEHTLLKEEKSKMAVVEIKSHPINKMLFEITKNYALLRY